MCKVLLVDDDKVTRKIITASLTTDYDILEASTGKEALKLFREHYHRIVLLDLELPDCHGLTVLSEVMRLNHETIVIVITGTDEEDTLLSAFDLGADDVLPKPFSPTLLKRKMEHIRAGQLYSKVSNMLYEVAAGLNQISAMLGVVGSGSGRSDSSAIRSGYGADGNIRERCSEGSCPATAEGDSMSERP